MQQRFPRRSLILQWQEKAGGLFFFVDIQKRNWFFFTAARRNKSIFHYLQSRSAFATAKKNIFRRLFLTDELRVEVVRRRLWSGILNPPDDFSQLSFLKTLLSRTEAASRKSSSSLGKTSGTLLWPNFNHWSRENAGTEVTFFLLLAGMLQQRFLHSRVSWVSYPDGVE